MKIHVHIERLVLDGLPLDRRAAPRVQAAVEAELSRAFMEGGAPPGLTSGGVYPSMRTAPIHVTAAQAPAQLGQAIAQSVHGGLQR